MLYGLVVYAVMNFIVLPLSAAPPRNAPAGAVLLNGLLIHVFGVGLPSALSAAWVSRREPGTASAASYRAGCGLGASFGVTATAGVPYFSTHATPSERSARNTKTTNPIE